MELGLPQTPPSDVSELGAYFGTFTNFEKQAPLPAQRRELGPQRAAAFMGACGLLPVPNSVRVVQVAGSKGKGSTVLWLESMLLSAGHRCGATLSPHLNRLNERIRIDGSEIEDSELVRLVAELHPPLQEHLRAAPELHPTFFDYWTTLSVLALTRSQVPFWLLEVGLGGPLDSTSAVPHDVGVLTRVDLEHTEWLGPTVEAIAAEKSKIARKGCPFVITAEEPHSEWTRIARDVAESRGAHCVEVWPVEAGVVDSPSLARSDVHRAGECPPSQLHNRSCAATVFQLLTEAAPPLEASPTLPGRLQIYRSERTPVPLLLDSAHTLVSLRAFCEYVEQWRETCSAERVVIAIGILQEKAEMLPQLTEALQRVQADWIAVAPPSPRALPAEGLGSTLQALDLNARAMPLDLALGELRRSRDPVAVTGSFYLAGWFRERW